MCPFARQLLLVIEAGDHVQVRVVLQGLSLRKRSSCLGMPDSPPPFARPRAGPEQQTISCFSSNRTQTVRCRFSCGVLLLAKSNNTPKVLPRVVQSSPAWLVTREPHPRTALQSGCTVSLVIGRFNFSIRHFASTNSTFGDLFSNANELTGRRPLFPNSSFVWSSSLTKASAKTEHTAAAF